GWTKVVNEQSPVFIGRYKPFAHLYPLHPVVSNLHGQWRPAQVVPDSRYRQWREEVLASLEHERHPTNEPILIGLQSEIPRGCGSFSKNFEVALRGIGSKKWCAILCLVSRGDERVFRSPNTLKLSVDFGLFEPIVEVGFAHVEEVSQHDCSSRIFYGSGKG